MPVWPWLRPTDRLGLSVRAAASRLTGGLQGEGSFYRGGSVVFTRNLARDILSFPELGDTELVLMDIDAERLAGAEKLVRRMVETAKAPARVVATTIVVRHLPGPTM